MKALIGTMNPGKIEGAKLALEKYFDSVEIEGYKASSDVGEQPLNEETIEGARNRVNNSIQYAKENHLEFDYYMGIESGIMEIGDSYFIVNVAIIKDKEGYESIGMGPVLPVPYRYTTEIINTDFGSLMKKIFREDLGRGVGGVDSLTNHSISRIDVTKEAFIMALTEQVHDYWR